MITQTKNQLIQRLDESLPSLIDNWLSQARSRSMKLLAELSGFRYPSLLQLSKGELSLQNIQVERIIALLAVLEKKSTAEVKSDYSSVLAEIERISIQYNRPNKIDLDLSFNTNFSNTFAEKLSNPIALAIYTLSLGATGVSVEEVKKQFGEYSTSIINMLIQSNLIIQSGKKATLFAINKDYVDIERDQIKKLIPTMNTFYQTAHAGQQRNFIGFRIDKVNNATLEKLQKLHATFQNEVNAVLAEEGHEGEIPIYTFNQLDSFVD